MASLAAARSGIHGVPGGSPGGGKAREGSLRNKQYTRMPYDARTVVMHNNATAP